jgi:NDP-sugar pyrophosphorylase family protein
MFGDIRESFEEIPVLFFVGGEEERMKGFTKGRISKCFLPINHDEPIFWNTFIALYKLGFRKFYFITRKKGREIEGYLKEKLKDFGDINILFLTPFTLLDDSNYEKSNNTTDIYIVENDEKGTGDQLLALKSTIKNRIFLKVYGDEHFGGEEEKLKNEMRRFILYGLEKIKKEKAIEVSAFVDKKIVIGSVWSKLVVGIEGDKREGKITKINNPKFAMTSLCMCSPEFFDVLLSEKTPALPLELSSPEFTKRIIESERAYGIFIDVEVFSNVNTIDDYYRLVSYYDEKIRENFTKIKIK